jgi:hypothetical protein
MIEAETVDSLPALRGEMEMPFIIRLRGAEYRDAILGTIRYGHVWDWSTRRVNDNAFKSLSKLGLFENYEFSNRVCISDEECARERDCKHLTHRSHYCYVPFSKQGPDC